jgi:hypothetical protein
VAQDIPDPTSGDSNRCLVFPGVYGDAYIQSTVSLDATAAPLMLTENGCASSGISALGSPMDVQHDSALVHGELETGFPSDFGAASCTVMEAITQLLYIAAFSHLSCSRYPSPSIAANSSCSEVHHIQSPGKTGPPAFCADDSPTEPPKSPPLFTEPVSAAFVGPVSPLPPSSPGFTNDYSMERSDDAPIPPLYLRSSPVRSSSPPNFFTSSPTRHALYKSPPTSPTPTEKLTAVLSTMDSIPLKRPRSPDEMATSTVDQGEGPGEETTKRKVRYAPDV